MGKHDKLGQRICDGSSDANIPFDDLCSMLTHLGFHCRRRGGSHHIFTCEGVREILNLQPGPSGKSKPYQVKQVRAVLKNYRIQ